MVPTSRWRQRFGFLAGSGWSSGGCEADGCGKAFSVTVALKPRDEDRCRLRFRPTLQGMAFAGALHEFETYSVLPTWRAASGKLPCQQKGASNHSAMNRGHVFAVQIVLQWTADTCSDAKAFCNEPRTRVRTQNHSATDRGHESRLQCSLQSSADTRSEAKSVCNKPRLEQRDCFNPFRHKGFLESAASDAPFQ